MQKKLSRISPSRLKNVYSLPTIYGIILFILLGFSLWYSIVNNSNIERWIFIMMLFMCLIHLLETSYPFRLIEVKVLAIDPPFSEEPARIDLQVKNPTDLRSGPLWVRLNGTTKWTQFNGLDADTSQKISIYFTFRGPGPQTLPNIRIKSYADSGLFRYWRVIDPRRSLIVLPKPVDHKIRASVKQYLLEDNDLTGLEEIRDPARFSLADPKLYRKTHRRYQRVFRSRRILDKMSFRWADLERLSRKQKGEQFSFWLKSMAELQHKQIFNINIEAPFVQLQSEACRIDWSSLKSSFAEWFYAKA